MSPISVDSSESFWHQPAVERMLRHAAAIGRIPRSMLFAGPEGTGKWAAALWVAQTLLCREKSDGVSCGVCRDCTRVRALTHPDLHLLFPIPSRSKEDAESTDEIKLEPSDLEFRAQKIADPFAVVRFTKRPVIKLDRIRALISELHKTAVEGGAKVVILHSVDQTRDDDCQSVLLKTIEEPPPDASFILTSASPDRLLPTIRSRCQMVRFVPVDDAVIEDRLVDEDSASRGEAETIARVASGGWGMAKRLMTSEHQAWRALATEFWHGAFRVSPAQLLTQIEATFRPGRKTVGFDAVLQAFDVWSLCLWRECNNRSSASSSDGRLGIIPDLDTGWACWRILDLGRSSLYVNVADRHAIAGTFLALRQRLGLTPVA